MYEMYASMSQYIYDSLNSPIEIAKSFVPSLFPTDNSSRWNATIVSSILAALFCFETIERIFSGKIRGSFSLATVSVSLNSFASRRRGSCKK